MKALVIASFCDFIYISDFFYFSSSSFFVIFAITYKSAKLRDSIFKEIQIISYTFSIYTV